jgi:hypothetical protein
MELSALRDNEHRCGQWEQDTEKKQRAMATSVRSVKPSPKRHTHGIVFRFSPSPCMCFFGFSLQPACIYTLCQTR